MKKDNVIINKTFDFALQVIEYTSLLEEQKKFVIARQLLRSGTSIGANVREAQGAESRADFIHKFKIAAKEAEETEYWLLLCEHSESYPSNKKLLEEIKELQKIISKIIYSAKSVPKLAH